MKKCVLGVFLTLMLACSKDNAVVDGKVVDDQNQPLEGVLVQVMGTDLFELSDADGNFVIDTKERGEELIFNKDGYQFERKSIDDVSDVILKKKD